LPLDGEGERAFPGFPPEIQPLLRGLRQAIDGRSKIARLMRIGEKGNSVP
jgi:hypothetical protein